MYGGPERDKSGAGGIDPLLGPPREPSLPGSSVGNRWLGIGIVAVALVLLAGFGATRLFGDEPVGSASRAASVATTVTAADPPATTTPTAPTPTAPTTTAPTTTPPTTPPTTTPPTTTPAATIAVPAGASIDTPGSVWWLVNPDRPLPSGYVPPDLVTPNVPLKSGTGASQLSAVAAMAFEAMVADAAAAGFELQLNSGYRLLEQQQMLYDRFVADYGAAVAAERVAEPGTSEHQTGLAADIGLVGLPDDQVFGDTEASVWVVANAHRFGFIVRYPPSKAEITGYANEPWHLRYVGTELAAELHSTGATMEEHFGLVPAATGG